MRKERQRNQSTASRPRSRRGSVLIYTMFLLVIMLSMTSLAVDYAHVQLVKTQLQKDADLSARGVLEMYATGGAASGATWAQILPTSTFNPVDANSGISDTIAVTWGYWNTSSNTFSTSSGTLTAVKIVVSRTAANGNAVPLIFPLMAGLGLVHTSCDVSATAIAALQPASSSTSTVAGTADVWLAGMTSGTASWGDTPSNASPVLAMNVTAGRTLTFSATGSTTYNTSSPYSSSDGDSIVTYHNEYAGDGEPGLQNGIQTITCPECALIGVFLTSAAPNTQTAPTSGLDYTSSASQNQASYSSLQLQQPFFIGNGSNSASVTQSFVVPTGATRIYLGLYDQCQNYDNKGSLSVTTTQMPQILLVQ